MWTLRAWNRPLRVAARCSLSLPAVGIDLANGIGVRLVSNAIELAYWKKFFSGVVLSLRISSINGYRSRMLNNRSIAPFCANWNRSISSTHKCRFSSIPQTANTVWSPRFSLHAMSIASLYFRISGALSSIKIASMSPSQLPSSLRGVCCSSVANWMEFALLSAKSSFVQWPCQRTSPCFLPSGSSSVSAYSGSRTTSQHSAALPFSVADINRPGISNGAQRVETTISGAPGTRLVR